MSRLIVVCEGGAHTVEYLHKNGVVPAVLLFEAYKFREMSSYLQPDDEVLVIIRGLTDFTVSEIYSLLDDIVEVQDKIKSWSLVSNVNLGRIDKEYHLYEGDLFYGTMRPVKWGKVGQVVPLPVSAEEGAKEGKNRATKGNKKEEKYSVNAVMARYKLYSKRNIEYKIYGSDTKARDLSDPAFDALSGKIVQLDLFPNQTVKDGN